MLLRIHQQRVAALKGVEIRLNAALRVQHKGINAVAGGKIANVIGDHAVQPADAVAAGHRDFGPPTQVIEAATREQGLELGARIAEIGRRGRAAVLTGFAPGSVVEVIKSNLDYNEGAFSGRKGFPVGLSDKDLCSARSGNGR